MGKILAVSGKGGTGKTTISTLMIRHIIRSIKKPVLAVDADSNSNLDLTLGVKIDKTIGGVREHLRENVSSLPAGMSKEVWVESLSEQALYEEKGFDLISMGRPEGPGCYCYLNNVFRRFLDNLSNSYPFVVIDNEAGMEHLSRRTTKSVDLMFMVSDATIRGIRTASRITELVDELGLNIGKLALIINRAKDPLPLELQDEIRSGGLDLAGCVPQDPLVAEYDIEGRSFLDLPDDSVAVRSVSGIIETYAI